MRLIDADLLKSDHNMGDECNKCKTKWRECQYDYIYSKMDFCTWIDDAPTIVQQEVKKISYADCADAMLMMWMDEVLTDGEYDRIMDKLNAHEMEQNDD